MRRVRFGQYRPCKPKPGPCLAGITESTCAPRPEGYVSPPMDPAAMAIQYSRPALLRQQRAAEEARRQQMHILDSTPLGVLHQRQGLQPLPPETPAALRTGGRRPPVVPGRPRPSRRMAPRRVQFQDTPEECPFYPEPVSPGYGGDYGGPCIQPRAPSVQQMMEVPDLITFDSPPMYQAQAAPVAASSPLGASCPADEMYYPSDDEDLMAFESTIYSPETPEPCEPADLMDVGVEIPEPAENPYLDPYFPGFHMAVPYRSRIDNFLQRYPPGVSHLHRVPTQRPAVIPLPYPSPPPYIPSPPPMPNSLQAFLNRNYPGGRDPCAMVPPPVPFLYTAAPRPADYVSPPPTPDPASMLGWMQSNYPGGQDPCVMVGSNARPYNARRARAQAYAARGGNC